ncbi:DNA cytosine methyltransferase [Nonomuraea rubra]|uniref:DNA cytosine methyltransferase n=1 Tax=Nonomuraea rubra TaxID=46180 RepID=UPI00360C09B9
MKRQPDLRVRPPAECRVCGPVVALQRWAKPHARKIVHGGQSAVFVCPNRRCGHLPVTPTARPLADVLEPGLPTRRIGDGKYVHKFVPYAEETRRKVEIGLRRFGGAPFIVVLRRNCTVLGMDEPLGTITAEGNHFAYIEPAATVDDSGLRMLSIREKARAQGFDDDHPLRGTGTEKNRLIGNAVPVTAAGWMSRRVAEVCS